MAIGSSKMVNYTGCPVWRGVPNSEVDLYTALYVLGLQTMYSLERCLLFRVSFIEKFHCSCNRS